MFGRRAGVDIENADIGKRTSRGVDCIREATLFTNLLPQTARSPSADDRTQKTCGIPVRSSRVWPRRCEHEMSLFEFTLLLDQDRSCGTRTAMVNCMRPCAGTAFTTIKRGRDEFNQ